MKLNLEMRAKWMELTGTVLRELSYGMTETNSSDTFTLGAQKNDMDINIRPIFCGLPVGGTEIKVTDFDTREVLPLGEEGEIALKSPSLMKGYWKKPEETNLVIQNGWIFTGDIGMLDEDGYLHVLGRTKEMLKVKGMSVFPLEVESLLGQNPAIEGSGVIGIPDDKKGQMPVAFIKLRDSYDGKETEDTILAWCKKKMATYKVPRIKIVKELPLTSTGKVKKDELYKLLD
jgi:acyl-CoA synthetase (AMP-forming)/AMP-acid ligase II